MYLYFDRYLQREPLKTIIRKNCKFFGTRPLDPTKNIAMLPTFLRSLTSSGRSQSLIFWMAVLEFMGSPSYAATVGSTFEKIFLALYLDTEIVDVVDLLETESMIPQIICMGLFSCPAFVKKASGLSRKQRTLMTCDKYHQWEFRGRGGKTARVNALLDCNLIIELAHQLRIKRVISYELYSQSISLACRSQKKSTKVGETSKRSFKHYSQLSHFLQYFSELAWRHNICFWHPYNSTENAQLDLGLTEASLALSIGCLCSNPGAGKCNVKNYVLVPGAKFVYENFGASNSEHIDLIESRDIEKAKSHPMVRELENFDANVEIFEEQRSPVCSTRFTWETVRSYASKGIQILSPNCKCYHCNPRIWGEGSNSVMSIRARNLRYVQ